MNLGAPNSFYLMVQRHCSRHLGCKRKEEEKKERIRVRRKDSQQRKSQRREQTSVPELGTGTEVLTKEASLGLALKGGSTA